ncbi:cysteine-rich receptor-like protein kinase 29 [Quercus suber]|uniref:Cysteine-rich receptor-like protein kinase 29 n=1 Tax=Quercus suber TaxID=58331 RepID=A0AAW0IRP1_QUESU
MELEGHMHKDKGLHEGKADFAEVGSQMKQVDGCQAIQSDLVVHDQNEIGTLSMDLDQSNFGLGPNTRTWKRQQVQAKVGDTVSSNDVEVGTKRKHKDVQDESASCCNGKQGGIFSTPSCVLRYETYRFSDPSAETPPPPPPSPPPELPTSTPGRVPAFAGKESNSSRTTIVVVVTTISAAALIISICICFYLRKRNPRKKVESLETMEGWDNI